MPNINVTYDQSLFLSHAADEDDLDPLGEVGLLQYTQQGSPEDPLNTYNLWSPTSTFRIGYVKSTSNNGMVAVYRYFVTFDTSAINRAPGNATFQIYGSATDGSNIICLESKKVSPTTLEETDWDGSDETNPIPYTNSIAPTTGWNSMTFTPAGLSAMRDLDYLEMSCVESDADYAQVEPAYGVQLEEFIAHGAGVFEPYLSYTMRPSDKISSGKVIISNGKLSIK